MMIQRKETKKTFRRHRYLQNGSLLVLPIYILLISACMDDLPPFRGPYLSWKSDPQTTMTVTYEHLESTPEQLIWGPSRNDLSNKIAVKPLKRRDDLYHHFSATLKGLSPSTTYFYKVPGLMDSPAEFRTAPKNAAEPFSFLVYGDSCEDDKQDKNEHYKIVRQMNRINAPSPIGFIISSGDLSPSYADVYGWDLHFDAVRDLADHLPYFTPFGNHDWNVRESSNIDLPGIKIHEFPTTHPKNHRVSAYKKSSYGFEYGSAYFIFIGYDRVGEKAGTPFNKWLESNLAYAEKNHLFTFVDFHVPPFDRREDGYEDNEAMLRYQAALFHKYHVTMVFSGHNHVLAHHEIEYQSSKDESLSAVTYIISGGGGQGLRVAKKGEWNNRYGLGYSGKTVFSKSINHFLRIDVEPADKRVRLTAFDIDGQVVYGPFEKQANRGE